MKKLIQWFTVALILVITLFNFLPVAPLSADSSNSITVTPSSITDSVSSGRTETYTITVSNGFALDVEVDGLGQTAAGATTALTAQNDTSPLTARPWVSVDKDHLDIGNSQILTVTLDVPSGTSPGERYAAIYMHSPLGNASGSTISSGVLIPLILTVDTASFTANAAGQITDLKVLNPYVGQAIDIVTYFSNSGNTRITNAMDAVTIKDSAQNVKWQSESPIASPSVLPYFPRAIDTMYNVGLSLGDYSATSEITLQDGTVYTKTVNFTIVNPPPVPAAPVPVSIGSGSAPGSAISMLTPTFQWNAVSTADYYTVTVSRSPYTTNDIVYTSDEITATSFTMPSGILFSGSKYYWQVTATNVTGTSTPAGLYFQISGPSTSSAVTTSSATGTAPASSTSNATPSKGTNWTLAGAGIAVCILIVGIVIILLLTRKPGESKK